MGDKCARTADLMCWPGLPVVLVSGAKWVKALLRFWLRLVWCRAASGGGDDLLLRS